MCSRKRRRRSVEAAGAPAARICLRSLTPSPLAAPRPPPVASQPPTGTPVFLHSLSTSPAASALNHATGVVTGPQESRSGSGRYGRCPVAVRWPPGAAEPFPGGVVHAFAENITAPPRKGARVVINGVPASDAASRLNGQFGVVAESLDASCGTMRVAVGAEGAGAGSAAEAYSVHPRFVHPVARFPSQSPSQWMTSRGMRCCFLQRSLPTSAHHPPPGGILWMALLLCAVETAGCCVRGHRASPPFFSVAREES